MALLTKATAKKVPAASMLTMNGKLVKPTNKQLSASMALFAPQPWLDNVYWSGAFASVGSFSVSFKVRTDAVDPCLVVDIITSGAQTVSTCTYNGVSVPMIQTASFTQAGTTLTIWQGVLAGPATGSNTLAVTLSTTADAILGIRSFTGIEQENPVNSYGFSTQMGVPTSTLTPSSYNCLVIDCCAGTGASGTNTLVASSALIKDAISTPGTFGTGAISHHLPLYSESISDSYTCGAIGGGTSEGIVGAIALNTLGWSLYRQTGKRVNGSTSTFSGTITKTSAFKLLASMKTFGATIAKDCGKATRGSMSLFGGILTKQTSKHLAAVMKVFNGTISAATGYGMTFLASMSAFAGSVTKATHKNASGSTSTFHASVTKSAAIKLLASLPKFAASISRQTAKYLTAVMNFFNATLSPGGKSYFVTLTANMNEFAGTIAKGAGKHLAGSMFRFNAAAAKATGKAVRSSMHVFSGSLSRVIVIHVKFQASMSAMGARVGKGASVTLAASMSDFTAAISAAKGMLGGWLAVLLGYARAAIISIGASAVPAIIAQESTPTVAAVICSGVSTIPALAGEGATDVPALVVFQGYVVENETYMSSLLLPLQIQQPFILFPGNTIPINWALIIGNTWNTTQTPVTDATGTLTIFDANGDPVTGATDLPMNSTDTPGLYQAVIPADAELVDGINYTTVITMSSTSLSATGQWTIPTTIRPRTTP